MPRIIDTSKEFDAFAAEVEMESPLTRETRWRERYEAAYPDVFEAFYEALGTRERPVAMLHNLSRVRRHAREAAEVLPAIIEEVDAGVARALEFDAGDGPVHVLLVGTAGANAVVGRLGGEVAVFHSLEWFQAPDPWRVAVAHETTHGWHEKHLAEPPPANDPAWAVFSEGLAVQTSRIVVPGRPEEEYFWYGLPGFDGWAAWSSAHAEELRQRLRQALGDPKAVNDLFGSGSVDGHHRTGYHVADALVAAMHRPLPQLARLTPAAAASAIRTALALT